MKPPNQHFRINLAELKAQIVKKLGPEGSKQYFYYLHRFLSLKLSKSEFDKLCLRVIGRENIPLHTQFIRSILRNACSAKAPPPTSHKDDDLLKHGTQITSKEISADCHQQNGSHTSLNQASGSPSLPNRRDMLPVSPRKTRTSLRDRKKTSFASQPCNANQGVNVMLENGDIHPPDIGRTLHHHQGLMQQADNESGGRPAKMSVNSKEQIELVVRNEGKEDSSRSPLRAPLGVPFCPVSIGGARRALPPASTSSRCIGAFNNGALLDSLTLREQMEQIALSQGIEGVSVDCANILNHGLDSYMKGLIRSCIELVGARSGHELSKKDANKHNPHTNLINGVRPGYQYQVQNSGVQEQKISSPISLHDFRVAMELNPRQLGEDWPLLLEKICTQSFEQ